MYLLMKWHINSRLFTKLDDFILFLFYMVKWSLGNKTFHFLLIILTEINFSIKICFPAHVRNVSRATIVFYYHDNLLLLHNPAFLQYIGGVYLFRQTFQVVLTHTIVIPSHGLITGFEYMYSTPYMDSFIPGKLHPLVHGRVSFLGHHHGQ